MERIVAQIREAWPKVRIIVRGDSGCCREWLMSWCEENGIERLFGMARSEENGIERLFGMARNERLRAEIESEMQQARELHKESGKAARVYKDFQYRTLDSWSRSRRVIGKAEYLDGGENPRFVVTSLPGKQWPAARLNEKLYCARGQMENRIKEQQLYLFAARTGSAGMGANQLRLWVSSCGLRADERTASDRSGRHRAQCHTIRLKLLKTGARLTVSLRRFVMHMAGGYPYQSLFHTALDRIQAACT